MHDSGSPWPEDDPQPSAVIRGLSHTGLVLLLLFLTSLSGSLFPITPLETAWQLRLGGALINSSPMPLTGLALLHLSALLDPGDPLLERRQRFATRLAVPAAIGFLLLIPLLSTAVLRTHTAQSLQQNLPLSRATSQLQVLRQAVASASSTDDLDLRLRAIQGPQLEPADLKRPLAEVRRRMNERLDLAAAAIEQQKAATPSVNRWTVVPEIVRTACACLVLAAGFACLGRRRDADVSFLSEICWWWQSQRLATLPLLDWRWIRPLRPPQKLHSGRPRRAAR